MDSRKGKNSSQKESLSKHLKKVTQGKRKKQKPIKSIEHKIFSSRNINRMSKKVKMESHLPPSKAAFTHYEKRHHPKFTNYTNPSKSKTHSQIQSGRVSHPANNENFSRIISGIKTHSRVAKTKARPKKLPIDGRDKWVNNSKNKDRLINLSMSENDEEKPFEMFRETSNFSIHGGKDSSLIKATQRSQDPIVFPKKLHNSKIQGKTHRDKIKTVSHLPTRRKNNKKESKSRHEALHRQAISGLMLESDGFQQPNKDIRGLNSTRNMRQLETIYYVNSMNSIPLMSELRLENDPKISELKKPKKRANFKEKSQSIAKKLKGFQRLERKTKHNTKLYNHGVAYPKKALARANTKKSKKKTKMTDRSLGDTLLSSSNLPTKVKDTKQFRAKGGKSHSRLKSADEFSKMIKSKTKRFKLGKDKGSRLSKNQETQEKRKKTFPEQMGSFKRDQQKRRFKKDTSYKVNPITEPPMFNYIDNEHFMEGRTSVGELQPNPQVYIPNNYEYYLRSTKNIPRLQDSIRSIVRVNPSTNNWHSQRSSHSQLYEYVRVPVPRINVSINDDTLYLPKTQNNISKSLMGPSPQIRNNLTKLKARNGLRRINNQPEPKFRKNYDPNLGYLERDIHNSGVRVASNRFLEYQLSNINDVAGERFSKPFSPRGYEDMAVMDLESLRSTDLIYNERLYPDHQIYGQVVKGENGERYYLMRKPTEEVVLVKAPPTVEEKRIQMMARHPDNQRLRPELDDTPSNDKSQPQKKVKGSSTRIEAGVLHTPADLSNSSLQRTLNSSVHDTDEFHDKYRYLNRERDEFNMLKRLISKESSGERPPQELHEILSLVKEADRFSITANNLYKHIKKRRKFNGYASADADREKNYQRLTKGISDFSKKMKKLRKVARMMGFTWQQSRVSSMQKGSELTNSIDIEGHLPTSRSKDFRISIENSDLIPTSHFEEDILSRNESPNFEGNSETGKANHTRVKMKKRSKMKMPKKPLHEFLKINSKQRRLTGQSNELSSMHFSKMSGSLATPSSKRNSQQLFLGKCPKQMNRKKLYSKTKRGKNSKKRDKLYFDIHKQEQARNREKIHKKQFSQKISREVQNVNHKTPEVATPKTLGYQQFSEKSSIEFKRFNPNPGMTNDSIGNFDLGTNGSNRVKDSKEKDNFFIKFSADKQIYNRRIEEDRKFIEEREKRSPLQKLTLEEVQSQDTNKLENTKLMNFIQQEMYSERGKEFKKQLKQIILEISKDGWKSPERVIYTGLASPGVCQSTTIIRWLSEY